MDLGKAYENLNSSFLFHARRHLGLPPSMLIYSLHTYSSMHLYVNEVIGRSIPVHSGVPQGCSLAPKLFICVIEPFPRFKKMVLPAFRVKLQVSLLMTCYVDDVTIFLGKSLQPWQRAFTS